MSQTQAYNPTAEPIGPVTYNTVTYIFQPDQKLKPGYFVEDPPHSGKLKHIAKPIRTNVISIPEDMVITVLKRADIVRDFHTDRLIVDQDVVNELELKRQELAEEVESLRAEKAEIMLQAKAEWEAEKAALLKRIVEAESEKKLAKGPVIK